MLWTPSNLLSSDLSNGLKTSLFCRNQIVPIIKGKLKGTKKERQNINDNQRIPIYIASFSVKKKIYLASFTFSPSYSHSLNLYENIPSSMHPLDLTLSIPNKFFFYFIILLCTIFYFPRVSTKTIMNQVHGLTDSDVLLRRTSSYQVEWGLVRQSMHTHLLV